MTAWREYLIQRVSLDLRALALFRIAFSVFLLVELCLHGIVASHAVGFLPLDLSLSWTRALAGSAIIVSLAAFAMGYKSRWSAFSMWLTYAFLHMGAQADGYHALTCAVLLLCVFLPTGRHVSLDDAMDRGAWSDGECRDGENSVVSIATAAVILFALGYVAMAVSWSLEFPLKSDRWHLVAGLLILASQLLPRSLDFLRVASIALFIAAMVAQGFKVGNDAAAFERMLLVALVLLLIPASFFARISNSKLFSTRHELRIYYDEPCGFCRKICYIFVSVLVLGRCQIATAQSDEVALKLLKDNDSWVVFDGNGEHALCWAAMLKLMRASPVWAPAGWVLTWLGMGVWGKPLYRLIGGSRNLLSTLTAALLPYAVYRLELRIGEKVLIAIWILLLLVHYSGASASLYASIPDMLGIFGFNETR